MDLISAIKEQERLAEDDLLKQERIDALDEYLGEPYGNEVTGRSQVVDRTIQNTVEWIKPQLLKTFCASDDVAVFNPIGPEDVEKAEQETDYVSHVATTKNNFFLTCYEWFSDALIQKNGYVKVWWDESESIEREEYDALTDDEFAMIGQDEEVQIVAHDTMPDEAGIAQREQAIQQLQMQLQQAQQAEPGQAQQIAQQLEQVLRTPKPMLHKVAVERTNKYGCAKFKCLPPEQVLVSRSTDSIMVGDANFFEHWEWKTISQLRLEGFDVPDTIGDESESDDLPDQQSRGDEAWWQRDTEENADPAMRMVKVREVWIRHDVNGDGKAELLHCIVVGNDILEQEEAGSVPVAALSPHLMPHRHVGLSISDAVADLQLIKTVLLRGMLDNVYLANNGRFAIDVDRVNLEDMLTSRPGGVVRTNGDPNGAIMPLTHNANFAPVMQMLAYVDDTAESRTGVTKYTQGLDANNLNKTATGVQSIMSAAQERVALIARVFAETGVKQLFLLLHEIVRKHQTKPDIVRLRNKWVVVDPREWTRRSDMTISVGLGTGSKQEQLAQLASLFQMQMTTLQVGLPVVQPANIYETIKNIAKNAGFRQPELFVTDPSQMPPKQPQPDPLLQIEQMKLQAKQQEVQAKMQADAQKSQMDAQIEQQKLQMQAQIEQQKAEAQLRQEQLRSQNDIAIKRDELQMQAELERYKAQLKAETDLKIAEMESQVRAQEIERQHMLNVHSAAMEEKRHTEQLQAMTKPKRVVRDQNGRVSGVE